MAIPSGTILSSLRLTIEDELRRVFEEIELDGWRVKLQATGREWRFVAKREGERHQRVFTVDDRALEAACYADIIEAARREARYLASATKFKHGIAVGVAGKWRKFGRAA